MSGYSFDRLKILVVDDNVHMRKLVVTILQAFGVSQIYEAESGERAWTMLREANPDVLVLDWVMEGMSGPGPGQDDAHHRRRPPIPSCR